MKEIKSNNYERLKINARVQDLGGGGEEEEEGDKTYKDDVQIQS